ncbi:MAG TPA: S8 family serine peptidase [Candidatus Polarisedimenticolia bacterium]|jgi:subtilisin family serine protease
MRRSSLLPAASLLLLLIAGLTAPGAWSGTAPAGRLLVKTRQDAGPRGLYEAMGRSGIAGTGVRWRSAATRWSAVEVPAGEDPVLLARRLALDPAVEAVEPDRIATISVVAADDLKPAQWGLDNTGQNVNGAVGLYDADIDAPEAWDLSRGARSVMVAVLDTGVHTDHPDLGANLSAGHDFVNSDSDPWDDAPLGHGTPVAGIIGAVGDNGTGIAGINWQVSLLPVKVCDAAGRCPYSAIVAGVEYAIARGARILNMSFTCDEHQRPDGSCGTSRPGACKSQMLLEALQAARSAGALAVTAAGNCGADLNGDTRAYPCAYGLDNVLCVGATDSEDEMAWFSNHGTKYVKVAAPGAGILSLSTYVGATLLWDGTSFSAPMASGVAALVLSRNSGFTPGALARRVASGDRLAPLAGLVKGGTRLNAVRAIEDLFGAAQALSSSRGGILNLTGDFNGDGLLDACEAGPSGHRVAAGYGSSLGAFEPWTARGAAATELAGDVNGDGRDDLITPAAGGVEVSLSSGSSFGAPRLWSTAPWRKITEAADVNGDGRVDLIQYAGGKGWLVSLSVGTSLAPPAPWSGGNPGTTRALGDFDGDSRKDLLRARDGRIEVSLSTGASFSPPDVWLRDEAGASMRAADLDGDGRDDLVRYLTSTGCFEAALSQGSSFAAPRPWTCGAAGAWSLGRFVAGGRADLVRLLPESGWWLSASIH